MSHNSLRKRCSFLIELNLLWEIFNYNLANTTKNNIDFKKQSKEDLNEKKNYYILYADSYLHLLLILQSASCFQHFLLSNIILFPNQYISIFVSTFIILRQNLCYMLCVVRHSQVVQVYSYLYLLLFIICSKVITFFLGFSA